MSARPVGRPPGIRKPVRVPVRLSPELAAKLDADRGDVPRSVWIAWLIWGRLAVRGTIAPSPLFPTLEPTLTMSREWAMPSADTLSIPPAVDLE